MIGLSYDTHETILKDAFEKYGEVIEGRLMDLTLIPQHVK